MITSIKEKLELPNFVQGRIETPSNQAFEGVRLLQY